MLSRLARRVPSHCASDIAASGTSSGGQTPWFTTRMSSPPSAPAASSTARLAPPGSPRSAWTATVSFRPLPPPTALIVSSASAFLLRYPTATLAPARASSSAVARPMPRPPPVTNARFPERSITAPPPVPNAECGVRSAECSGGHPGAGSLPCKLRIPHSALPIPHSRTQPLLHHVTHYVLDGEAQFLDPRRVIGRDDERHVGQFGELAAALADQGDDGDAAGARRLRGADHVGALPARRVEREHVAWARQGVELPREHLVEAHVVGAGGEQRRVGGERQGAQRGAARLIADHVLGREMLCVGGAAAVAGEEQRPARAQRDLVALRDGGDGGGVLGRHPCGEGGERFQSLAGPLRPAHAVIP